MNGVYWGTVYLLTICALALLGSLHSTANKDGYSIKGNYAAYFIVVISLLPILGISYLSSDVIKFEEWGSQGDYGQLGDFFGGILNPLIGFLSVFLLIQNLKILREESSNAKNKENRAEINKMIEDFSSFLDIQKDERNIPSIGTGFISLNDLKSKNVAFIPDHIIHKLNIKKIIENPTDDLGKENFGNFETLKAMRSKITSICELYTILIDKNQTHTINKFTFLKLEEFLKRQVDDDLILDTEYHQQLDKLSKKEGIDSEGFYRRIPQTVKASIDASSTVSQPSVKITSPIEPKS